MSRPPRTTFPDDKIPGRIHALQPFLSVGLLPENSEGVRHRRWWAVSGPATELGYLPARYVESARSAVYVVYSYGTPIAWVTENEDDRRNPYHFHVPDVSYSPTTGRHQMACVEAWERAMRRQGDYRRWPGRGREVVPVPGMTDVYGGQPGRRSRTLRPRSGGIDDHRAPQPEPRLHSAYMGVTGDAMHYSPTVTGEGRAHP